MLDCLRRVCFPALSVGMFSFRKRFLSRWGLCAHITVESDCLLGALVYFYWHLSSESVELVANSEASVYPKPAGEGSGIVPAGPFTMKMHRLRGVRQKLMNLDQRKNGMGIRSKIQMGLVRDIQIKMETYGFLLDQ